MAVETTYSDFVVGDPGTVSQSYTDFEEIGNGAYCTLWRANKGGDNGMLLRHWQSLSETVFRTTP